MNWLRMWRSARNAALGMAVLGAAGTVPSFAQKVGNDRATREVGRERSEKSSRERAGGAARETREKPARESRNRDAVGGANRASRNAKERAVRERGARSSADNKARTHAAASRAVKERAGANGRATAGSKNVAMRSHNKGNSAAIRGGGGRRVNVQAAPGRRAVPSGLQIARTPAAPNMRNTQPRVNPAGPAMIRVDRLRPGKAPSTTSRLRMICPKSPPKLSPLGPARLKPASKPTLKERVIDRVAGRYGPCCGIHKDCSSRAIRCGKIRDMQDRACCQHDKDLRSCGKPWHANDKCVSAAHRRMSERSPRPEMKFLFRRLSDRSRPSTP